MTVKTARSRTARSRTAKTSSKASSKFPERHGPKDGQGAEFPNKFPSGVDRETTSAAGSERPLSGMSRNKAAIYRTATRAEFPNERPQEGQFPEQVPDERKDRTTG